MRSLTDHSSPITALYLNSNTKTLISGSVDFSIKVWKFKNKYK